MEPEREREKEGERERERLNEIRKENELDDDDIYMCFHKTNLQSLWHIDNIKKSDKYDPDTFEYEWKGREIGWVKL